MAHDYFVDLEKHTDEFADCLVKINEKNKMIYLERLNEENGLLYEIKTIMESKSFVRALNEGHADEIEQYLKKPLIIGHSRSDLIKIRDQLNQIIIKQLEYEKCASESAIQSVGKEYGSKLNSLIHCDCFLKYYLGNKGKNKPIPHD